jgi:hypothetical protein
VPLHGTPLQPVKIDPCAAAAVIVTGSPCTNVAVQVGPQVMPDGLVVTTPVPGPDLATVNIPAMAKFATTDVSAFSVKRQVSPVHAPLQPVKKYPWAGEALSITMVPAANGAEHIAHEMPVGLLVTNPGPPPSLTVRNTLDGGGGITVPAGANVAVTDTSEPGTTTQVELLLQSPLLQPRNIEPALALAVRATGKLLLKRAEQLVPQEMPDGLLVTVPLPVPDSTTDTRSWRRSSRRRSALPCRLPCRYIRRRSIPEMSGREMAAPSA